LAGQRDLLWSLATVAVAQGELQEARDLLPRLRQSGFQPPLLDYLAARMEFQQEHWRQAADQLEKGHPLLALWPPEQKQAHRLLGKCYEQLGDSERQSVAYRRALALDPFCPAAHWGMGAALLAQGQFDKAMAEYGKVPGGNLIVARLLIERNLGRAED